MTRTCLLPLVSGLLVAALCGCGSARGPYADHGGQVREIETFVGLETALDVSSLMRERAATSDFLVKKAGQGKNDQGKKPAEIVMRHRSYHDLQGPPVVGHANMPIHHRAANRLVGIPVDAMKDDPSPGIKCRFRGGSLARD